MGYTGAPTDANGLVYLNARYLDPATGTFLTRDPLRGHGRQRYVAQPVQLYRRQPGQSH
ncbi:MAG: RHS repeat-associated core domain-containing protein [Chloroflexota bacterium]